MLRIVRLGPGGRAGRGVGVKRDSMGGEGGKLGEVENEIHWRTRLYHESIQRKDVEENRGVLSEADRFGWGRGEFQEAIRLFSKRIGQTRPELTPKIKRLSL